MSYRGQAELEDRAFELACEENDTDNPTNEQVEQAYQDIISSMMDDPD